MCWLDREAYFSRVQYISHISVYRCWCVDVRESILSRAQYTSISTVIQYISLTPAHRQWCVDLRENSIWVEYNTFLSHQHIDGHAIYFSHTSILTGMQYISLTLAYRQLCVDLGEKSILSRTQYNSLTPVHQLWCIGVREYFELKFNALLSTPVHRRWCIDFR